MEANTFTGANHQYTHQQPARLEQALVHKSDSINVFVGHIEQVPPTAQGHDNYLASMIIDTDHPFFFEHALDHVPGLMLIEGVRQVGTAISHMFYDVPFDLTFILNWLEVKFVDFAELQDPLLISMAITDKTYRRERLTGLACECHWLQHEQSIGTMDARWSFSSPATLARLRHSNSTHGHHSN